MKKLLFATLLLALCGVVDAQALFQYYGPAAGIQVNTGATYQNTTAVASDVAATYTGQSGCSGAVPLLFNGTCGTASSTPGGANTNVQFNSSGTFAGAADFSWITGTDTMLLGSTSHAPTITTNATTATGTGIALTVSSGTGGTTSGSGGALTVASGSAASTSTVTSGNGAALNISAGRGALNTSSTNVTGNGGAINITAGTSAGCVACVTETGDGGAINITAGRPDVVNAAAGNGGSVTITAGASSGTSGAKTAGSVTIQAGSGLPSSDTPGNIIIAAGSASPIQGSVTITGQQAQLFLQQGHSPEWSLGNNSNASNRFTGTAAGGVQLGSPTGGDCGAGCLNAQNLKINNVAVSTGGSGTVTSLASGSGISLSPSTITTTGTVAVNASVVAEQAQANVFTTIQTINSTSNPEFLVETNTTNNPQMLVEDITNFIIGGICLAGTANGCVGESEPLDSVVLNGANVLWEHASTEIDFVVGGVNQGTITSTSTPWVTQTSGTQTLTTNSGCTVNQNMSLFWAKTGKMIVMSWPGFSCTSNAAGGVTFPSVTSTIRPTTQANCSISIGDAGTNKMSFTSLSSAGTLAIAPATGVTFSGAGTFSFPRGTCAYDTDT